MLEILQFVFRDFWTFCGTVILLYIIGAYGVAAIACIFHHDSDDKNNKDNEEDKKSEYRSYLDGSYLEERK